MCICLRALARAAAVLLSLGRANINSFNVCNRRMNQSYLPLRKQFRLISGLIHLERITPHSQLSHDEIATLAADLVSLWLPGSRWVVPAPKRKPECRGPAPTSSPAVTLRGRPSLTMMTSTTSRPTPTPCPPPCLPWVPTPRLTVTVTQRW